MNLKGKNILIPGGSRPVGRAIASLFGEKGANLILPVFDWEDSIVEMEREFTKASFSFQSIKMDLRLEDEYMALVRLLDKEFGHLDILINNIERGGMPVVHGSYDHSHNKGQWEIEFDTTVKAKWLLYNRCLPFLQKAENAAVVNISSVAGELGRSGAAAVFFNDGYSAANRGIQSFTQTWARESSPKIRVNELCLGLIKSRHGQGTRGWAALSALEKQEILEQILLQRTGHPEEVAESVYFLAVTATYMTGTVLKMDGGFSLGASKVPKMPPGILTD